MVVGGTPRIVRYNGGDMKIAVKVIGVIVILYALVWGIGNILQSLWMEHEIKVLRISHESH